MKFNYHLCGLVVALYCVGYPSWADEQQRVEKLRTEAHAAHPGDIVEGTKAANKALERELNTIATAAQYSPKEAAIFAFLGYYAKNVIGMQQVCTDHGVQLVTYPSRFAELHAPLLKTVSRFVDTKSAIARAKLRAITNAKQELERVAASQGTDLRGVCKWAEENGVKLAEGAQFAKIMPNLYANLVQSP